MMTPLYCFLLLVVLVDGSVKKGVVHWADDYMCDDFKVLNNMTWWFDFRMNLSYFHENNICVSSIDNYKYNYVPMVWGYWSDTVIIIDDAAEFVLGFNEPNHGAQSNMSPEKAAAAWIEVEKNSKGKPLVSPSAAECGENCRSTEIEWFDKFFELCIDCRVDYLATHTYWCDAVKTMAYLESLYLRYGRKIWLTEFACKESPYELEQLYFMQDMLPQLEEAEFIYRYAWYSARLKTVSGFITKAASLLAQDRSELTELGRFYNNYQGEAVTVITNEPSTAVITNEPSVTTTSTPAQVTTTTNNNNINCGSTEFSTEETLLILQSYKTNPSDLSKMLRYVKRRSDTLSENVKALYQTASETVLMDRIQQAFTAIMCCDVNTIQNSAISKEVERIQKLRVGECDKPEELCVPTCVPGQ